MEFLFSNETKQMQTIYFEIEPSITTEEYENYKNKIDKLIIDSYESIDNDVEDQSDIICAINKIIDKMWICSDTFEKFYDLILLRKKAKKMANKKFREGHDYYYVDLIKINKIQPIIKYDETPRYYWNVEECVQQYDALIKYVWKPSVVEINKLANKFNK